MWWQSLCDLVAYRDLLLNLVYRELKVRYKGSLLGFLWSFVHPLVMFLVYYLVFSMLTDRFNMPHYELFLLSGLFPWIYFQSSIARATPSIRAHGMLLRQVYFPRVVLPISVVLSEAVHFCAALGVLLLLSLFIMKRMTPGIVLLPVVFIPHLLIALGFGLVFATLNVYFRDTEQIVNLLLTIWFFASPVFYSIDTAITKIPELTGSLGEKLGRLGEMLGNVLSLLYFANPMIYVLKSYNAFFYRVAYPSPVDIGVSYLAAVLVLLFGWWIFIRYQDTFAEEL